MSTPQIISLVRQKRRELIKLPEADALIFPEIRWGNRNELFTPAFWAAFYWISEAEGSLPCLGDRKELVEEVAFCILGGYGIKAEVNMAAFQRIQNCGYLEYSNPPTAVMIERELREPLNVDGRFVRYRFPAKKSEYLADALTRLSHFDDLPTEPISVRKWLLQFKGIGPKTASWIVRNVYDTDRVAIIDIHLHRAGLLLGLFSSADSVSRDYFSMEDRFLEFATRIGVPASKLDILIWNVMRNYPSEVKQAMLERN